MRDHLISPKHDPANPFSWNTVEVYASDALVKDVAARIAQTEWGYRPSTQELVWEFYTEYMRRGISEAFALGFNSDAPYRIACYVTYAKDEFPEDLTDKEQRALCLRRVRLDLPPLPSLFT